MPRNRTIYNSELIYAGPSPATGYHFNSAGGSAITGDSFTGVPTQSVVKELFRVQSFSHNSETPRRDVFQFGQLAALDRLVVDSPNVTVDMSYYASSFVNEKALGFTISSGLAETTCISGFLSKASDERNIFAKVVQEGSDAISNSSNSYAVFGFGNMSVTNYQAQGAVGDFPTASVTLEGQNLKTDLVASAADSSGQISPCIDANGNLIPSNKYAIPTGTSHAGAYPRDISVIAPGDIQFAISTYQEGMIDFNDLKIQDYNLQIGLSRTPLLKLGSKTAFSREIDTPINATLQINAIVGDYATGSISENIKRNTPYNITLTLNKPQFNYGTATVDGGTPAIRYTLRNAYLDSQNYSMDVGSNKTVTLSFNCPLSGPQDLSRGLFFSGVN